MRIRHTISRRRFLSISAGTAVFLASHCRESVAAGITPEAFGAKGDGRTDDSAALQAAMSSAVQSGAVLQLSRMYRFTRPLHLPANISVIGSDLEKSGLIRDGAGDGVVVDGACYLDNFTIDGGRPQNASRLQSTSGALLGIHGPMAQSPQYLEGVQIGTLRICNTSCRSAIAMANVRNASVGRFRLEHCWGNGLQLSGISGCTFGEIDAEDIGNLGSDGARLGSALALFPELDERKRPAEWFQSDGLLAIAENKFSRVFVRGATDTAVYLHNSNNSLGFDGIEFSDVQVNGAGHDGFKVRLHARNVKVERLQLARIALRGIVASEGASNVSINTASLSHIGYDAVGDILNSPAPFNGQTTGRSMSGIPMGISISESQQITINAADIRGVRQNPFNHTYGFGIYVEKSGGIRINAKVSDTDRNAARFAAMEDFSVTLESSDVNKAERGPIVLFADNGKGPSSNGKLLLNVRSPTATPCMPVHVTGACKNLEIQVSGASMECAGKNSKVDKEASAVRMSVP